MNIFQNIQMFRKLTVWLWAWSALIFLLLLFSLLMKVEVIQWGWGEASVAKAPTVHRLWTNRRCGAGWASASYAEAQSLILLPLLAFSLFACASKDCLEAHPARLRFAHAGASRQKIGGKWREKGVIKGEKGWDGDQTATTVQRARQWQTGPLMDRWLRSELWSRLRPNRS